MGLYATVVQFEGPEMITHDAEQWAVGSQRSSDGPKGH